MRCINGIKTRNSPVTATTCILKALKANNAVTHLYFTTTSSAGLPHTTISDTGLDYVTPHDAPAERTPIGLRSSDTRFCLVLK